MVWMVADGGRRPLAAYNLLLFWVENVDWHIRCFFNRRPDRIYDMDGGCLLCRFISFSHMLFQRGVNRPNK